MTKQRREGGFTLIEVAISVGVLSIIAVISLIATFGIKDDTQLKKREATLGLIEQAKTRYMLESSPNVIGQETEIGHITPYMAKKGEPINSLFGLVDGTGKTDSDLDLGSYGQRPASFDGNSGSPITSSVNNPYNSFDEFLAAAGFNPDFSLIDPTNGANWSNVLDSPEGAAALEEYLSQIPTDLLPEIASTPNLSPESALVLLLNMPVNADSILAARDIFFKSLNPLDPLYTVKGDLDYANYPWKWPSNIPYAGQDLSGTSITGANLNPDGYDPTDPAWDNWGGMNFTGANLSGIDMTGFQWESTYVTGLALPVVTGFISKENFTNVNFTGAQNININKLVLSSDNGAILTGTGITKAAYEQGLLNTFGSIFENSNSQQVSMGQQPYWTPSAIQTWLNTKTTGITFDQ